MKKSDLKAGDLYIMTKEDGIARVRYFLLNQLKKHPKIQGMNYYVSLKSQIGKISVQEYADFSFLKKLKDFGNGIFFLQPICAGIAGLKLPPHLKVVVTSDKVQIFKNVLKNREYSYVLIKTINSI